MLVTFAAAKGSRVTSTSETELTIFEMFPDLVCVLDIAQVGIGEHLISYGLVSNFVNLLQFHVVLVVLTPILVLTFGRVFELYSQSAESFAPRSGIESIHVFEEVTY